MGAEAVQRILMMLYQRISGATVQQIADEHDGTGSAIYALYDYDADGDRAARAVEEQLPEFAPGVPISFERLAVTPQQITAWNLPTRPPKAKDPQAAMWGNQPCVELDAIDPTRLTALVENAITRHVDKRQWQIEEAVEEEERKGLRALLDGRADGEQGGR